jgi:predicted phage tail protein
MTSKMKLRAARWLIAVAAAIGAAVAQAAGGVSVTMSQASSVRTGMTTAEVEQMLGRPAHTVSYRNAPGPTWIYRVIDPTFGMTDFDVSFGADGKVVYASERVIGGSGR